MTAVLGVVVPCRDEAATITRCLRALSAQDPAPARVVVVDNGSTDDSPLLAAALADEVRTVVGPSIAGLRNAGAAALLDAQPDVEVIAFVDADTEVAPDWTRHALAAVDRGADLVGSRTEAAPDAPWVATRWAAIESRTAHDGSQVWSQHLAVRRSTFERLGGFREDLATGEDADLSARVRHAGGRVVLEPAMRAVHHGFPATLRRFLRRERWHTRAPGWFPRMSGRSRALVLASAGWGAVGAVAVAAGVVRRRPAVPGAWLAATAAALPALGAVGGDRRRAPQDGVLLALWSVVRVARLPRELAARPVVEEAAR